MAVYFCLINDGTFMSTVHISIPVRSCVPSSFSIYSAHHAYNSHIYIIYKISSTKYKIKLSHTRYTPPSHTFLLDTDMTACTGKELLRMPHVCSYMRSISIAI